MEMKNVAFAAIFIVCLSVAYYFAIALPNQNKEKLAFEKQKFEMEQREKEAAKAEKENKDRQKTLDYNNCCNEALKHYDDNWELNCRKLNRGSNCSLPGVMADSINRWLRERQEECRKVYLENH